MGEPVGLSWSLVRDLLPAAFAIAMLGAIESLLCAVVLDGMTGKRHSANSELMGQGLGNIITPFFGGITATAAIARSAANYRAGAESPVSAMVHSLVVLLALVSLAGLLAYLPMPAMAALLVMVAWNMSEAPKSLHLLKTAPRSDILVFLTCFSLTVLLDMVIAITTGVLLAAVLFMREMAQMTRVTDITQSKRIAESRLPHGWQDNTAHVVRGASNLVRPGHVGGAYAGDGHAVDRVVLVCLEFVENFMNGVLASAHLGVVLVDEPLTKEGLLAAGGQRTGVDNPVNTADPGGLKAVVHPQHVQLHGEMGSVVTATQQVGQVEDAVRLGGENRFNHVFELGDIPVHHADLVAVFVK